MISEEEFINFFYVPPATYAEWICDTDKRYYGDQAQLEAETVIEWEAEG